MFTEKISECELASIVSRNWLNVHTSITEGWGYSILEASACGTPTVAYEVPSVVDTIDNGINGLKIKDMDRGSFVNAVITILSNPKQWQKSSRNFAENYSWDKTAEIWDTFIRNVIKKK